eukprot:3941890-Rhodomonas_salina.1
MEGAGRQDERGGVGGGGHSSAGRYCPTRIGAMLAEYVPPAPEKEVPFPIGLRACYAMSGTDIACAAMVLRACYAMSGTDLLSYHPTCLLLRDARHAVCGTELAYGAMGCPCVGRETVRLLNQLLVKPPSQTYLPMRLVKPICLCACYGMSGATCYAMSGTNLPYGATRTTGSQRPGTTLCVAYAMSGTELGYGATRRSMVGAVKAALGMGTGTPGIILRPCYAKSGTELASGTIGLRRCYAKSGTDIAYAGVLLRKSGTDIAVGKVPVMPCPVLTERMVVPGFVVCYELMTGGLKIGLLVSPYALATRCPVLTKRRVVSRYALAT